MDLPETLRDNASQFRIERRKPSLAQQEMCNHLAEQHSDEDPEIILNAGLDEHDDLFSMVIVGAAGQGRACIIRTDGSTQWMDD